jgi:iron(III) transport system permease protein
VDPRRTLAAAARSLKPKPGPRWTDKGTFVVAAIILTLGFYLIFPVALILGLSFNVNPLFFAREGREWGLDNWRLAFSDTRIVTALWNTVWLFAVSQAISLPFSVIVAWLLGRAKLPGASALEIGYWISYVTPGGLIAWIMLLDPDLGFANLALEMLPFIDNGPFNIYSIPGLIFIHVIGGASSTSVLILTPIFRNMDASLEEAARVSGASTMRTMMRVTVPVMISPIALLFGLQLMRMFTSFEREFILGTPIGFFVYSTLIYDFIRAHEPPLYGSATAMASLTLLLIIIIIPFQRWILTRRRYTTISGSFRPGQIDLGPWKWLAFGFVISDHLINLFTFVVMIGGSLMTISGLFILDPWFTFDHWIFVLKERTFISALQTTLVISFAAGILSPLLFALLAYTIVRTQWKLRDGLDMLIWVSGAIPGILAGLGLLLMFLWVPGLRLMYGTIWVLILVVVIAGNTSGVNLFKAYIVNIGYDMEEAARISGAGWWKTFFTIWLRLLAPYLVLIGLFNFNQAANTTAPVILLASRETTPMSILILEWLQQGGLGREKAAVLQVILGFVTLFTAIAARHYGRKLGVRHS